MGSQSIFDTFEPIGWVAVNFELRTLWILNNQCIILHHSSKRKAKRSYLFHLAIHKVSKDFFVPPPDSNLYCNSTFIGSGSKDVIPVLVEMYLIWKISTFLSHFWRYLRIIPAKSLYFVCLGDSLATPKVLSISWHVTIELIRLYTHCLFQDFRDLWKSFKNV